jgi:predicted Fe-Mo cluster-binding NifX family protein
MNYMNYMGNTVEGLALNKKYARAGCSHIIPDYDVLYSCLSKLPVSAIDSIKIKNEFLKDAKTRMQIKSDGVYFNSSSSKYGIPVTVKVIPLIEDVKVINDRVVIVTFSDKTIEKAVLSEEDTYSLEQGVSICITKRILSSITNGKGSSAYNKLVDYGLKVYKTKLKNEADKERADKEAKERRIKKQEKERRRKEKLKTKEREEKIEIQAEAIRRAMKANSDTSETAE